ncbi:insulin-like growth factor II [Macrosteles quadrilineatus]|uniref:insulin-like growth factor II n=1 Tax=Macrosteles quadrilineatus TaxID=74068 RepID=UPI0023E26AC0|nr:insulin-like growth factor II [Macrosteles quadrilineatus]
MTRPAVWFLTACCIMILVQSSLQASTFRFCGKTLARTLKLICNRFEPIGSEETYNIERQKRSISEECCMKYCTLADIKAYCVLS